MFAYCGNEPIQRADPSGTYAAYRSLVHAEPTVIITGAVIGALVFGAVTASKSESSTTASSLKSDLLETYKYAKQMLQEALESTRRKTPHVHHIVPTGTFSGRSPDIQILMHELFGKYEVNIALDPINLMIVSAETHARLHTDEYIRQVYRLVAPVKSKEELYYALYLLRIDIALKDKFACGF